MSEENTELFALEVVDTSLDEEMRRSYLDYAMSVIVGRALPDARDGLKPVHRRALFAMHELGNSWNRAYKKSARIVGDVIGKYHPHGDSAVYETIVRMAQDFSLRYTLVDGQGNFGSVDGDSAAAMRYTEIRLDRIAHEILADLDMETVDFGPNYDGSELEPLVMPTRIPNLLINGSEGIAVGMATKIPPHNLSDVIDACVALLDDRNVDMDALIGIIKAPDFPTGGTIWGGAGCRTAYETGTGSVVIRAKAHFEDMERGGRQAIVIDELPYQVNKKTLQENMAKLVMEKEIEGISNIQDESDKSGMRLVIELKKGESPDVTLNQLYKKTDLQRTFGVNFVAIVDGQPQMLNLKRALEIFLDHRREVLFRKATFELRKTKERGHVLAGFAIALSNLDEMVEMIKGSSDPQTAKAVLMGRDWGSDIVARMTGSPFTGRLSETQAQEILQLRLQKLTGMEQDKIVSEYAEAVATIADLEDFLAKESRVDAAVRAGLLEVKAQYGDARKTAIDPVGGNCDDEDLIPRRDMVVTISNFGYVKTQPVSDYEAQRRGGRGKSATDMREEDWAKGVFTANSHDTLLCLAENGKAYPIKVYALPEGSRGSRGRPLVNFLPDSGISITKILPVSEFVENQYLVLCTAAGIIKRTPLDDYKNIRTNGLVAMNLDDGDKMVAGVVTGGASDLLLFTSDGKAVRFDETALRPLSRQARGVRGVRLSPGAAVVSMLSSGSDDELVLTVSELGYAKRTAVSRFRKTARGGSGVMAMPNVDAIGKIKKAMSVSESSHLLAITKSGVLIRVRAEEVRTTLSRTAKGVRLLKLDAGETLSDAYPVGDELMPLDTDLLAGE